MDLTSRIKQYLELDTNYAIIINGDYGIGKTYYIKNSLFPKIKTFKVPNTDDETFLPILVSLFGAKSIEDIQNQIFIELFPILKNKGVKIIAGLGRVFLKYSGIDADDLINATDASSEKLIKYNKIVLCIDDIDRKSKDLDLKEVFGFINNLVENLDAKVLLIANEDELRKEINDDGSYYSMLREKVIGISVTFRSNTDEIYDEIISTKYKTQNNEYYKFLIKNKKIILLRIEQNNQNLRNLIFFLEHFKIIFIELDNFLKTHVQFKDVAEDLKISILNFTLPIAIEYKMGKLNSSNFEDVQNTYQGNIFDISMFLANNEVEKKEESYSDTYDKKYLRGEDFNRIYFDSIFQYILGNEFFNFEKLEKEINDIYKVEDNVIPEKEILLQKLNYWKCLDIGYAEYKKLTTKLLLFVDAGEFPLDQYSSIFYYAIRFENLLGYDIPKLVERFKKGIKKGNPKYKYISSLSLKLSTDSTAEYFKELKDISNLCIKINENIKKEAHMSRVATLFQILKDGDIEIFLDKLKDSEEDFRYKPVFAEFNFNAFWKAIKKLDNSKIIKLAFELGYRYKSNIPDELFPEKEFLIRLKKEIDTFIGRKSRKKLEIVAHTFLKEKIDRAISNFSSEA